MIRQALEQARKWGLIARSPAVDATPPRQVRHEVTPPTVSEVRDLVAAARGEDPEFGTYLWLLAATGCRRGEGCALRWSDVMAESDAEVQDLLKALIALLADERESRVQDDSSSRKTEILLADAGLSSSLIAQLIGKQPDAVRKAISRARQSRTSRS